MVFLSTLRILLGLYLDMRGNPTRSEWMTDISLLILFSSLLIFILKNPSTRYVHPGVGVALILLLGLNFMQFGGVNGSVEYNYYIGIYFIALVFSGRTMFGLLAFQLGLLAVMLYLYVDDHNLKKLLFDRESGGYIDFSFAILGVIIISYFLKVSTRNEILKAEELNASLSEKITRSKEQHQKLLLQAEELSTIQQQLAVEVAKRTQALLQQNEAIEAYIRYNTTTLRIPERKLCNAIKSFTGDTHYHRLLAVSGEELEVVIHRIQKALDEDGILNRSKVTGA